MRFNDTIKGPSFPHLLTIIGVFAVILRHVLLYSQDGCNHLLALHPHTQCSKIIKEKKTAFFPLSLFKTENNILTTSYHMYLPLFVMLFLNLDYDYMCHYINSLCLRLSPGNTLNLDYCIFYRGLNGKYVRLYRTHSFSITYSYVLLLFLTL